MLAQAQKKKISKKICVSERLPITDLAMVMNGSILCLSVRADKLISSDSIACIAYRFCRSWWAGGIRSACLCIAACLHDQLTNELALRMLTVVDNWNRKRVLLETSFRLTSQGVILALDRAAQSRRLPASNAVDLVRSLPSWWWMIGRILTKWVWYLQGLEKLKIMGVSNHLTVDLEMNV
jgi:hypothetical protein